MIRILFAFCFFITFSFSAEWLTDFDKATTVAKKESKFTLINITGSDWCIYCKLLEKEIFETDEFKAYANKNLSLLKVDFPQRKFITEAQLSANKAVVKKFSFVPETDPFPTLIVLNPSGKEIGRMGYVPGGPKPFIKELEKITKK